MDNNIISVTPADEIASTTPVTGTTGEPVTNQAPAAFTAKLPDGYIMEGFMETSPDGKHRFLKRDYVDRYAKELAAALTTGTHSLASADFKSAFLRDSKRLLRGEHPDGAKLTAAATMQVQAVKLVASDKAPAILCDMIAKTTAAVTDAETFQALYTHLDAVYTYILQREPKKAKKQEGGE